MTPPRPKTYDKKIGLVLQGGGALGSYQAGVYEALAASDYIPDWVAGISIGAINAALIAGNAPENRVARLRDFWRGITTRWPSAMNGAAWADGAAVPWMNGMGAAWMNGAGTAWQQRTSAWSTLMFGQPGFFAPRLPSEWLSPDTLVSYYDTSALKSTLEKLIDFDRINETKDIRLSVGAVNVVTGQFAYFDSAKEKIQVEHVMASGALPPGFPPVEIDGEHYWDGGLFSNTPLQYVIDTSPRRSRLTFQVDLFAAHGQLPTNLDAVNEREKDLRYSSRTRAVTESLAAKHEVRHAINALYEKLPKELAESPEGRRLYHYGCVTEMDIALLIYRPGAPQGSAKDFEFSRTTMEERWAEGLSDMRTTLLASPWLAPIPNDTGVRVFDVVHDILVGNRKEPEGDTRMRPARKSASGRHP